MGQEAKMSAALDGDIAKLAGLPSELTAEETGAQTHDYDCGFGHITYILRIWPQKATYHWYCEDYLDMGQDMEYTTETNEYGRIEVLALDTSRKTMSFKLHSTGKEQRNYSLYEIGGCQAKEGNKPEFRDVDEVPSKATWVNGTSLTGTVNISYGDGSFDILP